MLQCHASCCALQAYADYIDILELTEAMVRACAVAVAAQQQVRQCRVRLLQTESAVGISMCADSCAGRTHWLDTPCCLRHTSRMACVYLPQTVAVAPCSESSRVLLSIRASKSMWAAPFDEPAWRTSSPRRACNPAVPTTVLLNPPPKPSRHGCEDDVC